MKIIERMFQLMDMKNIRPIDLANELNISKGVISNWKRRNTNPPAEYIKPLANFLGVSTDFLLTGEDSENSKSINHTSAELLNDISDLNKSDVNKLQLFVNFLKYAEIQKNSSLENKLTRVAEEPTPYTTNHLPKEEKIYIPMLGYVAAGQPIALPDDYTFDDVVAIPSTKEAAQADFALQIKGDSMYPLIEDGDTILVKKQNTARDGQIVVASINNATTLKEFRQFPDRIELRAINKKYKPIIINNEYTDFKILGVKL